MDYSGQVLQVHLNIKTPAKNFFAQALKKRLWRTSARSNLDESAQQRFAERSFRTHFALRDVLANDVSDNTSA
jgi:hypothetical protein